MAAQRPDATLNASCKLFQCSRGASLLHPNSGYEWGGVGVGVENSCFTRCCTGDGVSDADADES